MIVKAFVPVSRLYLAKDEDRKELITHSRRTDVLHDSLYVSQCLVLSCGGIPLRFFFFQFVTFGFTLMT